ncbi:lysophospholipid acyltransferase family protein [Hymenobacter sp. AT01-02]|uniref:lysophospholipid acyltransferase family protein n=1 Tax=Hymenobacter sp. AT01-02 TaxID=1571877 RepID=UPI0005F104D5|nr:lysophospholipid acyltransferase family protein [Hymenobacter sp. AT01-02]
MQLTSKSNVSSSGSLGRRYQELLRPLWQPWAQLRMLRQLYARHQHLTGRAFIGHLLRDLNIKVRYNPAELRQIPSDGSFLAIANQPGGLLESLVLLYVLGDARPDLRIIADEILAPLQPNIANLITAPSPTATTVGPGAAELVPHVLRYLHNDTPLLVFSQGGRGPRFPVLADASTSAWQPSLHQLIAAVQTPVLPVSVSFEPSNSWGVYRVVRPFLLGATIPADLVGMQGKIVHVRLGRPCTTKHLNSVSAAERSACVQAQFTGRGAISEASKQLVQPLAALATTYALEAEIQALRPSRSLLRHHQWEVYMAKMAEIPTVLGEIKRLRLASPRPLTEDALRNLPEYDAHHWHVFLYDRINHRLAAACRLGRGRNLLQQHGKKGFYLHSLFRLKKALLPLLHESVEVSSICVCEQYAQQPLPAVLLWKALAEYFIRYPEYRYLIGSLNVSRQFPAVPKAALMRYLHQHHTDPALASLVRARKQVRYHAFTDEPHALPDTSELQQLTDSSSFGKDGGLTTSEIPVALRQYIWQNTRLLGVNLNPACSNSLDGFLVLDARKLPARAHRLLDA